MAQIISHVDTAVIQAFMNEFDKHAKGVPTVMVLDNASRDGLINSTTHESHSVKS